MKKTIIEVKSVSKKFRLPHQKINSVKESFTSIFQPKTFEELHALKDISFKVNQGEFLGIIGPNGSGKSTLLKILAGIYQPDSGRVEIKGKISPFLELGVGFNPELTARENVFLNGIVLGLSHRQIEKKYPEIVKFAGLEKFMDAKLKTFSSGMQVRLAFSVAIQVPADIFLIDEVLAVGDVEFQQKCFRIFYELQRQGKTIIFVSHDLGTQKDFAHRLILLEQGRIKSIGEPSSVILGYQKQSLQLSSRNLGQISPNTNSADLKITNVRFLNAEGKPSKVFQTGDDIIVEISYQARKEILKPVVGLAIHNEKGAEICGPNTKTSKFNIDKIKGPGKVFYHIKKNPLLAGEYFVTCGIFDWSTRHTFDFIDRGYSFRILPNMENQHGTVKLEEKWELVK